MSLVHLLNIWRADANFTPNIAAWHTFEAQPAHVAPFPADLHPTLRDALVAQGIDALYSHQIAAWQKTQSGQHPVIITGTASGKTLCYNLPVVDSLLRSAETRALYLFPTKALARDQAGALEQLAVTHRSSVTSHRSSVISSQPSAFSLQPSAVAIYDGDTPTAARPAIRRQARVVISNPDMLHTGILPHHTRWADFFGHLRFIVIDEMHIYRGVFGSHVANVIRRLKRIARFYGAAPQFILTSATIANPLELAGRLIEEPVVLVDNDGAPRGPRHFLIYNPPIVNPEFGLRRSALQESVRLAQNLLEQDVQSLVFGRTRRAVEMLLTHLREGPSPPSPPLPNWERASGGIRANLSPPDPPKGGESEPIPPSGGLGGQKSDLKLTHMGSGGEGRIRAYRSGYLPRQRRQIEQGLRDGSVRAVVATNALELGIDIGGIEAVILTGYPGTIAGTWQQAGRAGRQQAAALAVLVASANPLDQFLAHQPDYFFERSPEQALINPDNLLILLQHLRCAAFELPFQQGDDFGRVKADHVTEFLQFLHAAGELHRSDLKYFWMADHYPAQNVSLRSASPEKVILQAQNEADAWLTIGEVDLASAPWLVHPQAIYLHEGQSYYVEELDLEQKLAYLKPAAADYYTEPRRETTVQLLNVSKQVEVTGGLKAYGELLVTSQVTGYKAIRWFSHERIGEGDVSLPSSELQTGGYWLALNETTVEQIRAQGLWRSDRNDYGPNWQRQRNRARARDGYRCQICGAPETERQHDVHHRTPFRTFASAEQANRLSNLVTLCRACHRRAETAVKVRSGLAGLATVLGHLAPLFLMCDSHDIAVHSDPQSPLSQGRPTVIIYELIPAGLGFSQRLFELHHDLLRHAQDLVAACPCAEGCPSCAGPAGEAGQGGKAETLAILGVLGGGV